MTHPAARRRRCKSCRAWTWVGLDEDLCGFPVRIDPTPLTARGEAAARLLGLDTFDRDETDRLWRRTRHDISARPAGSAHPLYLGVVVAEHACAITLTAFEQPAATRSRPRPAPTQCPY